MDDKLTQAISQAYRILLDGEKVGGVVITLDKENNKGDLDLLFVSPEVHSKGLSEVLPQRSLVRRDGYF